MSTDPMFLCVARQVEEERVGRVELEAHLMALRERHVVDLASLREEAVDLESQLRSAGRMKMDMKDVVGRLKAADG